MHHDEIVNRPVAEPRNREAIMASFHDSTDGPSRWGFRSGFLAPADQGAIIGVDPGVWQDPDATGEFTLDPVSVIAPRRRPAGEGN